MDTPTHLLDQALNLFAARGYDAVGVQEIVASSGVTKPTLYHHFGNKQGVFEAVISRDANPLLERLREATVYRNDLPRNLHQIIETYLQFATSQTNFYRLLTSCYLAPPESDPYRIAKPVHEKQHALVEAMFEHAGVNHGNMRGRARRYAYSFIGLVNTCIVLVLAEEIDVSDQLKYDIVQQFSYGIYT